MRRAALVLAAATLGLGTAFAAGACGSEDDGGGEATGTNPTASAPGAPPPPTDATTPGTDTSGGGTTTGGGETGGTPAGGGEDDGGTDGAAASADFSIGGTKMTPPQITVPQFVPIDLSLKSTDGQRHSIAVSVGGDVYRVGSEADGSPATTRMPGLEPGIYPVRGDGGQQSNLVVGGEPGP